MSIKLEEYHPGFPHRLHSKLSSMLDKIKAASENGQRIDCFKVGSDEAIFARHCRSLNQPTLLNSNGHPT
ncbi:MAG: hypothetical protein U0Z26_02355 [Anaerolineales bacterium]